MTLNNRKGEMKNKKVTMEDFDNWLENCPVPYNRTCNGLNTTEHYSFDLKDVDLSEQEEE